MDLAQTATGATSNAQPFDAQPLAQPLNTALQQPALAQAALAQLALEQSATSAEALKTLLQSIPLFAGLTLTANEWQPLLNSVTQQTFAPDQVIFSQGETGELLYLILSGSVEIQVASLPIQIMEAGSYFGEMALFDAQPRSATAIARHACQCLVLTQPNLRQLIQTHPTVAIEMMRVMAIRLRHLSRLLSAIEDIASGDSTHFATSGRMGGEQ